MSPRRSSAQSVTQAFDDNGNLLTRTDPSGTLTYTWDARNRLAALSGPSVNASFTYDGLGRRAQRTVNSLVTQFLYDGLDAVKESSGGVDVAYLRSLGIDEALVRTDASDTLQYLGEAQGSTVALTNPAGTAATTYTYEPFGRTETTGAPNPNPFRFTGREDDGTGLYYYRARYYDPTRSRLVSEDPIGLLGGLNVFSYAANNPIRHFDPLGQDIRVSRYVGARGAGHVGIGVVSGEGEGTVGYYPDPRAPGNPITGQQGLVRPDDPNKRRGTLVIRTTPGQDLCVEQCINSRTADPGTYKLLENNCKDFVHECLASCGIPAAGPPAPWGYFDALRQVHGQ